MAVASAGVLVWYAPRASAAWWGGGSKHHCDDERHAAVEKSLAEKNYQAWVELMANRRVARVITEDTFPRFAEMHRLQEEGKWEEAHAIREELGLGKNGRGGHHGGRWR